MIKMTRPLLSIIIPTRNRQDYLMNVLQCLIKTTKAEIVISDNSDEPINFKDLEKIDVVSKSQRIKYSYTNEKLSVVDNFNKALSLSTGEYVIFIGDDDCVGPSIESIVDWAKTQDADAVISYREKFIASYYWPEINTQSFRGSFAGKLFLRKFTGKTRRVNGKREIKKVANNPGTGLSGLLRVYHGIVKRSLIDQIIDKYGTIFGGVSPDIYSATLISYECKKAYWIDYPFVVPGASPKSTAGDVTAGAHLDKLGNREHITRFGNGLIWDQEIPEFYATHTVWAYSQQQALKKIGDKKYQIVLPNLYWRCLMKYRNHWTEIFEAMRFSRKQRQRQSFMPLRVLQSLSKACLLQASRVGRKFFFPPTVYSNVNCIEDAYDVLEANILPWKSDVQTISEK
jgi:glycosyltransferase involved in cell wall biosynthesis